MLRIIVRTVDSSTACNIGGPGTPLDVSFDTFEIDAPHIEEFLTEFVGKQNACVERCVIGVELCADETKR